MRTIFFLKEGSVWRGMFYVNKNNPPYCRHYLVNPKWKMNRGRARLMHLNKKNYSKKSLFWAYIALLANYHRDPFDRMLIAQAMVERFTLITRDKNIMKYKISIIKA
jgi:hypothetical protein